MRNYTSKHVADLKLGGVGMKRALLDVPRFLRFAVKKSGAESGYLPLQGVELEELERTLHKRFRDVRLPQTEYFRLSDEQVQKVHRLIVDLAEF